MICEFDSPREFLAIYMYFHVHLFVVFNTLLSYVFEYADMRVPFLKHTDWIILLMSRVFSLLFTLAKVKILQELSLLLGLHISFWSYDHMEESLHVLRYLAVRELVLNRGWNSIFFEALR